MSERPNYKSLGVEIKENIYVEEQATQEPQCIQERLTVEVDPTSKNLTKEEYKDAKETVYNKDFLKFRFPRIYKQRVDPPLTGQLYSLHTFIPSSGATPDKDGCFGCLKIRGTFPNMNEADEFAEKIIRTTDSYNENFISYVGREFPLTLTSKYCRYTREIDVQNKLDQVSRENTKKQKEKEEKEIEEIKDKERKLLSESKEEPVKDDIKAYTTLRVKLANAKYAKEEVEKKLKTVLDLIVKTTQEVEEFDSKFPEYKKQYMEEYVKALTQAGVAVKENPLIKYMNAYDETTLNSMLTTEHKMDVTFIDATGNKTSEVKVTSVESKDEKKAVVTSGLSLI